MKLSLAILLLSTLCAENEARSVSLEPRVRAVRGGARGLRRASAAKPVAKPSLKPSIPPGTAEVPEEVFNLVKSIVGAGVLGLPAGIAAFGSAPSAVFPGLLLLAAIGSLSAYGFWLIGQVCAETDALSYRAAWQSTVGQAAWLPAAACLMVTGCTVLTYSMILADTLPALLLAATGISVDRRVALTALTASVLLPLCLMKELRKLAPFSLLGIAGTVYTAIAMIVRFLSGSYREPSTLLASLPGKFQPNFADDGWRSVLTGPSAILVCMLSTAYMAHYNAPKFYWELKDKAAYGRMVGASFLGSVALMGSIMAAGYLTFGGASSSLILNNYAAGDLPMNLAKFAIATSLIFSYPLAFVGVRDQLFDLVKVDMSARSKLIVPSTLALLTLVTALAFVLKDIRVILALGGATWGNCVIYLFPAAMVLAASSEFPALERQARPALALGLMGTIFGILGTQRALAMA